MSPRLSSDLHLGRPQSKKRRSLSPEPAPLIDDAVSSSPPPQSSPSQQKLERISNGNAFARFNKPALQSLASPSSNALKRLRKPVLSALVQPSDDDPIQPVSAFPITSGLSGKNMPHTRRAVSALIPPKGFGFSEQYSDESSFDGPEMSSPAQAYAKRQQVTTVRRCDGTDDLKPLTGITSREVESPSSRFMAAGLPGFGDNEAHGKILPCHRVTEDGLMRVNANTVSVLSCPTLAHNKSKFLLVAG
jgi:M-phase inducer tyrosine phosphatase